MNRILTTLLLVSLFALSCRKTNIDPALIINVNDEFTLDLWETLDGTRPDFNFLIKTIKEYDCADNTITYDLEVRDNNIIIVTLEQIDQPNDCEVGSAPAAADIAINDLQEGKFDVRIKLKETIKNQGSLLITPEKYTFTLTDDAVGINLVREELYRVPYGTVWGIVSYQNNQAKAYAEQFLAEAQALENTTEKSFTPGYYGYFEVFDNQSIRVITDANSQSQHLPFLMDYEGDINILKNKMDAIVSEAQGQIEVQLFYFL